MGVAEPLRRPTASRGRKRPRAAARLVGTSRAACCRPRLRVNPFLVWFVFLWLLFSGVWETLIFGTGDWIAFGEPFFCGLFTPTYPLPGHRLVPETHFVFCLVCFFCSEINLSVFVKTMLFAQNMISFINTERKRGPLCGLVVWPKSRSQRNARFQKSVRFLKNCRFAAKHPFGGGNRKNA